MTNVNTTACVVVAFLALCGCGSDTEPQDIGAPDLDIQGSGPVAPLPGTPISIPPRPNVWPCVNDAGCSDGNECTLDYCHNGKCSHTDTTYLNSCMDLGRYGFCYAGECCVGCLGSSPLTCVANCQDGLVCTMQHVCQ